MKAVLCKSWGAPESLVVEDVPALKAGPGQVVVGVKACGVNFPDTLIIQGKYQFKPEMPFSPGGEVAGEIKSLGEGVSGVKVGDRVIAFTGWGGFAEEVVTTPDKLLPMPAGMDFAIASSFVMTYGTSHHALKQRAELKAGETLLVLGAAGGVGLAAVEIGKVMGAKVIAAASTAEKLAVCKAHGADELINYTTEDLRGRLKDLIGDKGVDVVYDPIGGQYSEPALRSTGWKGRFLVVGFASGEIPKIPLNLTLLKGNSIVGVFWGDFTRREKKLNMESLQELGAWFAAGKLKPLVSKQYKLHEAAQALNDLMQRKVTGKVILTP
jgi:NADPH:quinone reductase